MPEKPWKQAERRVAQLFGGRRTKMGGERSVDVDAGIYQIEVKFRAELPEWIAAAVRKARDHATSGQLGLAVLREAGSSRGLVVLDMADFLEWFGKGESDATASEAGPG